MFLLLTRGITLTLRLISICFKTVLHSFHGRIPSLGVEYCQFGSSSASWEARKCQNAVPLLYGKQGKMASHANSTSGCPDIHGIILIMITCQSDSCAGCQVSVFRISFLIKNDTSFFSLTVNKFRKNNFFQKPILDGLELLLVYRHAKSQVCTRPGSWIKKNKLMTGRNFFLCFARKYCT